MGEVAFIVDQLKRSHGGEAWHGPALGELLQDLTAERAAARPLPGAHNIWEIALHIAGWEGVVRRRLQGHQADEPDEGDWPPAGESTTDAWANALARLAKAHQDLVIEVSALDESRLRETAVGTTYSVRFMLHGVIQHNLYHAGQIAVLKKAEA